MAMAFEYYLDTDYEFNTDFQKKLAEYLSQEYMEYINDQNLSVSESAVDIDINGDGDKDDVVDLTIEYDGEKICRYQRIRWDLSYALSERI